MRPALGLDRADESSRVARGPPTTNRGRLFRRAFAINVIRALPFFYLRSVNVGHGCMGPEPVEPARALWVQAQIEIKGLP